MADLGFEKGGFLLGGQSPPAVLAALARGIWGYAAPGKFWKMDALRCNLARSGVVLE